MTTLLHYKLFHPHTDIYIYIFSEYIYVGHKGRGFIETGNERGEVTRARTTSPDSFDPSPRLNLRSDLDQSNFSLSLSCRFLQPLFSYEFVFPSLILLFTK